MVLALRRSAPEAPVAQDPERVCAMGAFVGTDTPARCEGGQVLPGDLHRLVGSRVIGRQQPRHQLSPVGARLAAGSHAHEELITPNRWVKRLYAQATQERAVGALARVRDA